MWERRVPTVPEVAERLRVKPATNGRWLRESRLNGFMPGGTKTGYRALDSELDQFIVASHKTPLAERAG